MKKGLPSPEDLLLEDAERAAQAALSHIEVSNALHIIGMFMPKLGFGLALVLLITGFSTGATSVARSQDAVS